MTIEEFMYDVVVIGGGPGGYAAAIRVAQLGGKAALVEAQDLGGTCVNRGCIPSKIWMRAARLVQLFGQSEMFGIDASVNGLKLETLVDRKNGVAADIQNGMNALLGNNGVELVTGRAALKSAGEVEVDGKILSTKKIILATGSSLMDAGKIPGLAEAALTSDEVFNMKSVPSSVLIFGDAGPIEVEIATLMRTFGCEVHLTTRNARILPREDGDVSQRIARSLRDRGIQITTRLELTELQKSSALAAARVDDEADRDMAKVLKEQGILMPNRDGTAVNGYKPVFSDKKSPVESVERVLVSARQPNTDGLKLGEVGVQLNEDGSVKVDDKLQTTVAGVYAIGDVTGGWMISHASSAMGITAAENAMGQDKTFDSNLIPRGIWTSPQVGAIGLSEEEAEEKGFDVEVGNFPCSINGLAASYGEVEGATKVVWDAETRDILGIHIVAPFATEMMGEAVMALQLECSTDEIAHSISIHPTISETIMDAARDAAGWALYLPKS